MIKKLDLRHILINSLKDFRSNYINFFIFESIFMLISEITIIPLSFLAINTLIKASGNELVSNWEIISFLLSPVGITTIFLGFFLVMLRLFLEFSGVFTIINESEDKSIKRIFNIIKNTVFAIPKTIIYFIVQYLVSFIISITISFIMGFIIINIKRNGSSGFSKFFLFFYENKLLFYFLITMGIFAILISLVNRIFVPYLFLMKNKTLRSSIQESKKMIKPYFWEVFLTMIFMLTVFIIIITLTLTPFTILKEDIVNNLPFEGKGDAFLSASLIMFCYFLLFFAAFLAVPFIGCFINNLVKHIAKESEEYSYLLFKNTGVIKNTKNKIFYFILFLTVFFFISFLLSVYISIPSETNYPKVTAHRGSSFNTPGNSISSILKAVSEGSDYIEFDVQLTKDRKIILFHDANPSKYINNTTSIYKLNYSDLSGVDLGKGFTEQYLGEKVPTLEEIFAILKDYPFIGMNIEIKNYSKDISIVKNIFDLINIYELKNHIYFSSTDYEVLKEIKSLSPNTKTGLILMLFFGNIINSEVDFFSLSSVLVNQDLVNKIKKVGKDIHVWTVNDEKDMGYFIDLGVDNIITDKPLILIKEIYKRKLLNNAKKNFLYLLNI